jgi:GR25 family glycosyltransferase involved in LPS biosynthesis
MNIDNLPQVLVPILNSFDFKQSNFNSEEASELFDLIVKLIRSKKTNEENRQLLRNCQKELLSKIHSNYIFYFQNKVNEINNFIKNNKNKKDLVTITMTTCKRLDLFTKTVNSFLNCVLDIHLISEWFVIDDNSSENDRNIMKNLYPFITFIFKNENEKGHAKSMNIIRNIVKTKYLFHLEDDWEFFYPDNYLTYTKNVLNEENNIFQCLINLGYSEREQNVMVTHGNSFFYNDILYYYHDYTPDQEKQAKIASKMPTCCYWPNYSLRPSMLLTSVFEKVGEYSVEASHFEMEYAFRFTNLGMKSVFLDSIYTYHIGRCTWERHDKNKVNAYTLNNEEQFVKTEKITDLFLLEEEKEIEENFKKEEIKEEETNISMKVFVLSLKRRIDRRKDFILKNHKKLYKLNWSFFDAIDGKEIEITPKILKIFETGDYNYRRGIIGCALSHIKMWELLINSEVDTFLILEDDVEIHPNFLEQLNILYSKIKNTNWDLCYLGHFLYPHLQNSDYKNVNKEVNIIQHDVEWALSNNMGGTIGYIINKKGAMNMLNHINKFGNYNAIDWTMFKNKELNSYYCYPHLVYSECVTDVKKVDSDIQYCYDSLCDSFVKRINFEKTFWEEYGKVVFTKVFPIKEILLSCIVFKEINNNESDFQMYKENPVGFYLILNKYIVSFPLSLDINNIKHKISLYGNYLV